MFESASFEVHDGSKCILVIIIYVLPEISLKRYRKDLLSEYINSRTFFNCSDFYFKISNFPYHDTHIDDDTDFFTSLGLNQHVLGTTHVSCKTLDLVLTGSTSTLISSAATVDGLSDHMTVTYSVPFHICRHLKNIPNEIFISDLKTLMVQPTLQHVLTLCDFELYHVSSSHLLKFLTYFPLFLLSPYMILL